MNPHSERHYSYIRNDNSDRRTKAIAAIHMAVIIFTAALVSGLLSLIGSSYQQPAMAQLNNMTASGVTGSTSTDGDNSTTIRRGGEVQSSACVVTQTEGTFDDGVIVGGTSAFDDYDADTEGEGSAAAIGTTNATSTTTEAAGVGANQSTSEVRDFIEEACIALQVEDTQGALMYLDMALNALGGDGIQANITGTTNG